MLSLVDSLLSEIDYGDDDEESVPETPKTPQPIVRLTPTSDRVTDDYEDRDAVFKNKDLDQGQVFFALERNFFLHQRAADTEVRAGIKKLFYELGIDDVRYVGRGAFALVFEAKATKFSGDVVIKFMES